MKVSQSIFRMGENYQETPNLKANLVLGFGAKSILEDALLIKKILKTYPNAICVICSSAGEIYKEDVLDNTLSLAVIEFETTKMQSKGISILEYGNSFEAGRDLVKDFDIEGLKYIFVLSDGSKVNGSELVKGMVSVIPERIPITGGLAGDGDKFESTLVGINEIPTHGRIAAIAFYGEQLLVSHSSLGGWESFGLERTVTKSDANELFEIDGKNALELYKMYLGKYAEDLPSSALLFPLSVKIDEKGGNLVRTILSVNNQKQSMIFAGDIPVGSKVRFMKANFDRLIDAASMAATNSLTNFENIEPKIAILISCVGRKLILGDRIDEEVAAVKDSIGPNTLITGFYSYGELSPLNPGTTCELHNQTMTITCFDEKNL